MSGTKTERAALLRKFMHQQRRNRTRQQLGLLPRPTGGTALTQEDLAEVTSYALTTIRTFESGRLRSPRPEFLDTIATTLDMSGPERRFLFDLAAGQPPPTTADCQKMQSQDPALNRLVHDAYPDPALLIDPAFQVQAHNRAAADWITNFTPDNASGANLAVWIFTSPHAAHVFPEWAHVITPAIVARIRAAQAHLRHDQHVADLVHELCERSPRARRLWHQDATVIDWPTTWLMRHPGNTNPQQADDSAHHVTTQAVFLNPPTEGDERLLITFLLPDKHRNPYNPVISETTCTACAAGGATTRGGAA